MEVWEHPEMSKIWKTKSSFMSYIRGCLRKAWNRHPSKVITLREKRKQIKNPSGKGKEFIWGFECEMCNNTFTQKEGQVDHITPAGSLQEISDIQSFSERLLCVTPDDLRLICKECNSALAYADRQGISFEEALATKKAIAIQKDKKCELQWFSDRGIVPASNAKKRREQIINSSKE